MEKQSRNKGDLNRNLYVILKFAKRPRTPGINLKKHGFLWRESDIGRWFHALLDQINAVSIYKEMELEVIV